MPPANRAQQTLSPEQVIAIVRPVIADELKRQDAKFEAYRSEMMDKVDSMAVKLEGAAVRINEIYANGSGGPKGFLEKMEKVQTERWNEWRESQSNIMQQFLDFMHISKKRDEREEMRAEVLKELAAEKTHERRKIIYWAKTAAGLAGSTGLWEVGRALYHHYHPIAVHVVSAGVIHQ